MKNRALAATVIVLFLGILGAARLGRAAEQSGFQGFEYATIRWGGRENTQLIRPSGEVELLGPLLTPVKRPDRAEERAFYMNVALNAAAREGYELQSMTLDVYVLRRSLNR